MVEIEYDQFGLPVLQEELWEMIIERLHPNTRRIFIMAFPHLFTSNRMKIRKGWWLFELTLPHLLNWKGSSKLDASDIGNLRLSCKRFQKAVDLYLESQHQLKAYDPNDENQLSIEYQWNCNPHLELAETLLGYHRLYYKPHYGGITLDTALIDTVKTSSDVNQVIKKDVHNLSWAVRDFADHPPHRNPFPSRSVAINWLYEPSDPENEIHVPWNWTKEQTEQAYKDIHDFMERFGNHIYYFKLAMDFFGVMKGGLIPLLNSMPNLCSFQFTDSDTSVPVQVVEEYVDSIRGKMPKLMNLKTLKIFRAPAPVIRLLAGSYGYQITRLEYELFNDDAVNLKSAFPNLIELDLMIGVGTDPERVLPSDLEYFIIRFFGLVKPDNIQKIRINIANTVGNENGFSICIERLFRALKQFPNLRYFGMGIQCVLFNFFNCEQENPLKDTEDSLEKLEYLSFCDNTALNLDFLSCCPALRNLLLIQEAVPAPYTSTFSSTIAVREEMQTGNVYKSNIWTKLKKLREFKIQSYIFVGNEVEFAYFFYNRWGFDAHQRMLAETENGPGLQLYNLRRDIWKFLKKQEEYYNVDN